MKTALIRLSLSFMFILVLFACSEDKSTEPTIEPGDVTLFDKILYYDGYAETVDDPVPDGILRIANSKYVTMITDDEISKLGKILDLDITVEAACDNYDRIGNVFLSLVNKGEAYDPETLAGTIEIARFITPFMDMNESPNEVPYTFAIDNIAKLLTDPDMRSKYDFWFEFDIFGVPYAANQQIEGCAGKNHVFYGTLTLTSGTESVKASDQVFVPVAAFQNFNNYNASDIIGETTRTFEIDIPAAAENAELYLITSNHGAQSGGEEYNRRVHNIYFDGDLLDAYTPGGKSCEPYRQYNTQLNGIYGYSSRTDASWASFSNWCPGDVIPIRTYDLGNLEAGTHTFKIEVPDAEFRGADGNIPLSLYIQGDKL